MKRFTILLTILTLSLLITTAAWAQTPVTTKNLSVKISTGTKQVKAIYVNLKDWEIRPVLAKNTVGATESLADMAKRSGAVAAINGTFFNSYSDMQPHGTIQIESKFAHSGTNGTTMGITNDNKLIFENLNIGIEGSINDSYEWPNNWYAWGINHVYTDPAAIIIFTPAKGKTIGNNNATSVVVKDGVVAEIRKGVVNIPANGFVITANSQAKGVADKFRIGDRVSYRYNFNQVTKNGPKVNWDNVRHALGAGPRLLTNGKITVDFTKERMKDPKLTTNKGARSFIGVDKNGLVVMGTVSSATVKELAEVAQKIGLINAMNLDGGASSSLYLQGKYLTKPGRLLSNSLVVVKRTTPVVKPPSASDQATKHYEEGKKLEQNGDLSGAKDKYLAALKINNQLTDAHLKLGLIYYKEQNYPAAIEHLNLAINLNPKNPAPYETIAWAYYSQHKYTEAIAAFERLAAADQNSRAKGYYGIGLCYSSYQVNNKTMSREYFNKAIEADPNGQIGHNAREQLNKLS
ncbi:MAG: phosphodiester glycosidase family protein [Thermincolia bacterium]